MFGSATPIFRSFDETLARGFYIDFLEFEVLFEHRFEPNTPLYLGLVKGGCSLHLSEHFGDAAPGGHIRIEVDDVEAWCATLNAKRYRHARPMCQD
ncbi:MAG: VOC family protein, partial [Burkholderiaceae bacterium]